MARIFLDSGVLLEGGRGTGARQEAALYFLEDPRHQLLTSPFVYLETVPKASHYGRLKEVEFYEQYFARAESLHDLSAIFERGLDVIDRYGVGPMDALHVAAAELLNADALSPRSSLALPVC